MRTADFLSIVFFSSLSAAAGRCHEHWQGRHDLQGRLVLPTFMSMFAGKTHIILSKRRFNLAVFPKNMCNNGVEAAEGSGGTALNEARVIYVA